MFRLICKTAAVSIVALSIVQVAHRPVIAQTLEQKREWLAKRGPVVQQEIETWKRSGEPHASGLVAKFQQEYTQLLRDAQMEPSKKPAGPIKCDRNDPATFYACEFVPK